LFFVFVDNFSIYKLIAIKTFYII